MLAQTHKSPELVTSFKPLEVHKGLAFQNGKNFRASFYILVHSKMPIKNLRCSSMNLFSWAILFYKNCCCGFFYNWPDLTSERDWFVLFYKKVSHENFSGEFLGFFYVPFATRSFCQRLLSYLPHMSRFFVINYDEPYGFFLDVAQTWSCFLH